MKKALLITFSSITCTFFLLTRGREWDEGKTKKYEKILLKRNQKEDKLEKKMG